MLDDFPYDVLQSHNHADKPRLRRLAERLKAAGAKKEAEGGRMTAKMPIHPSSLILHPLREPGLEQSRVLPLCISSAALASGWVALKRSTAVHRDPANAGRRFIPLLLGDCALPDTLQS